MLIYGGNRAEKALSQMVEFLTSLQSLPSAILEGGFSSVVAASLSDVTAFAAESSPKVFPTGAVVTLAGVSYFRGSMTLAQALTRDLTPGETRISLVSKCISLLDRRGMGMDPVLKSKAQAIKGQKK